MNASEYPAAPMSLVSIAAKSLQETGKFVASDEDHYKGRKADRVALAICCDLRDIGVDCHVHGATITMDEA